MSQSEAKEMNLNKVARGAIFVFVATFIGLGLNYLYGIMLARWLGADKFGLFAMGLSVFNILAVISIMGLDNAALRFIPGAMSAGRMTEVKSLVRIVIILGCFGGLLAALALLLSADFLANVFFNEKHLTLVLCIFALAIPAYSVGTVLFGILQAMHDVRWRIFIKYISEPVVKLVLTIALLVIGWGVSGALTGFVISLWLSLLLAFVVVSSKLKNLPPVLDSDKSRADSLANVMTYSLPILLGTIFSMVANRSDILILGHNFTATQVGIYAAALQTAGIISIILQSVESIVAPVISEALASGSRERIEEVYALSLRWVIKLGLPLCISFLLFSEYILGFFGEAFKMATLCFSLLVVAQFINLATGSANYVLLLSGKSRMVMWNEIVIGGGQICLNILLIPKFGIVGAAMAMLIAISAVNVLRVFQVYGLLKIQPYQWVLFKPVLAAVIVFVSFDWVKQMIPGGLTLILVPLVFIVYFVLLMMFGLHDQDRQALYSLLQRRRSI